MIQSVLRKIFLLLAILFCNNCVAQDLNLTNYNAFIQKNFPAFIKHFNAQKLNQFTTNGVQELELNEESFTTQPYTADEWDAYIKVYNYFLQYNKSKTYFIDLLSGGTYIEYKNGKYYGSSDVDQEVKLGVIDKKTTYRLSFTGPSGGFAEAKWVNNNVVIIVGYHNEVSDRNIPIISIYDFEKKKSITYYGENNTAKRPYSGKLFKQIIYDN